MEEMVVKPASIVKKELEENIVKQINESKLPMFIVEYVLKDILHNVKMASQQQLEFDVKNYENGLKQCSTTDISNSNK